MSAAGSSASTASSSAGTRESEPSITSFITTASRRDCLTSAGRAAEDLDSGCLAGSASTRTKTARRQRLHGRRLPAARCTPAAGEYEEAGDSIAAGLDRRPQTPGGPLRLSHLASAGLDLLCMCYSVPRSGPVTLQTTPDTSSHVPVFSHVHAFGRSSIFWCHLSSNHQYDRQAEPLCSSADRLADHAALLGPVLRHISLCPSFFDWKGAYKCFLHMFVNTALIRHHIYRCVSNKFVLYTGIIMRSNLSGQYKSDSNLLHL